MPGHRYAVAIGSNRPLKGRLGPRAIAAAALDALDQGPLRLLAASPIMDSAPLGPSLRRFANAAAIVETALPPLGLLAHLKRMERLFGRRRGRRWSARTLDLDILLWSGGRWSRGALRVPHPAFRDRLFVLAPLASIASDWRDPASGRTIRQLLFVKRRPKPVDPMGKRL